MVENAEKRPLIETLRARYPDKNIVYSAVLEIKTAKEILRFRREYEAYLKQKVKDAQAREEAGVVADTNIGRFLGLCDELTAHRWLDALRGTDHYSLVMTAYAEQREVFVDVRIQIGKREQTSK